MKEFYYSSIEHKKVGVIDLAIDLCDEVPNIPYCKCWGPCDICKNCIFADSFYNYDGAED